MGAASDKEENQIRSWLSNLESEGLTDALTDEAATMLLQGEQQLNNLAHLSLTRPI
jgi:hypothetical protein